MEHIKTRITLAKHEIRMAVYVGVERALIALFRNSTGFNVAKNPNHTRWAYDIEAAAAEYAAAKGLGLLWDGSYNTFKQADIGKKIQVRHTKESGNCLIIRPDDKKDEIFVLVIGSIPNFYIMGGIVGGNAMHEKYLREYNNGPPAYFVPQKDLKPVSEIIEK